MKAKRERVSAGLLIFRRQDGSVLEVLLVHPGGPFFQNKDEGVWSIPKGVIEHENEDLLARGKAEFEEELGVAPTNANFIELGLVKQKGGKTVYGFACEGNFSGPPHSNTFECEWPPHSGQWRTYPEIDDAQWFDLENARKKINFAQVAFLDRLIAKL